MTSILERAKVRFYSTPPADVRPDAVRRELRRRGLPYGIAKGGGTWYVFGGDSSGWVSSSLNRYRLQGTASAIVDDIQRLASDPQNNP